MIESVQLAFILFYTSCVCTCMLHGSETWPVNKDSELKRQWAETRIIRWICGAKVTDRFTCSLLRERLGIDYIIRMWGSAQRDGHPAKYRWCPVLNAAKFGSCPLLECHAVTLPIGECKTWRTKSEFCTWQNSVTGQQPPKCIYRAAAQETTKHRSKFGWLLLSNIAAVMKPRRETR